MRSGGISSLLVGALLLALAATAEAMDDASLEVNRGIFSEEVDSVLRVDDKMIDDFLRSRAPGDKPVPCFEALAEAMKKSVRQYMHQRPEGRIALTLMIVELLDGPSAVPEMRRKLADIQNDKLLTEKQLKAALRNVLIEKTKDLNDSTLGKRTDEPVVTLMDFTPTERARSRALRSFLYDSLTYGKDAWFTSENVFKTAARAWLKKKFDDKGAPLIDGLATKSMKHVSQFLIRKLLVDNIAFTHASWAPNGQDITYGKWNKVINIMAHTLAGRSSVLGEACNEDTILLAGSSLNFPQPDDYDLTCVLPDKVFETVVSDLMKTEKGDKLATLYTANLFLTEETLANLEKIFHSLGVRPDVHFSLVKKGGKYDSPPLLQGATPDFRGGRFYTQLYPLNEELFSVFPLEVILHSRMPETFWRNVDGRAKVTVPYERRGISCRDDAALAYPLAGPAPQCARCSEKFRSESGEWLRGYSCDGRGSTCNGNPDVLCYTYRRTTCVCGPSPGPFVDGNRWGGRIDIL